MDFMKVFDQTVREIKREVNIKVLKVPEIEQKVLDATDSEPWGPHGTALAEIAQGTKKFSDCQMIMNVLWTRLTDTGRNWRHVYKALAVIEYLVSHGSERALDDITEHTFQISSLSGFEYVEPNGKDMGINIRKKVESLLALLNNKDRIQEVRDKAAANRDKYFGLSSSGITYKSGSTSHGDYGSSSFQNAGRYGGIGSSSFPNTDRYGGIGSTKEGDMFKDGYKYRDQFGDKEFGKDSRDTAHRGIASEKEGNNVKKGGQDALSSSISSAASKLNHSDEKYSAPPNNLDDDFDDDFDPRGTSTKTTSGVAAPSVQQTDMFIDLMDTPASVPTQMNPSVDTNAAAEVDLFADATFVSASPNATAEAGPQSQEDVDLFASQPVFPSAPAASTVDIFAAPDAVLETKSKSPNADLSQPKNSSIVDPFAAVPLNCFDGSNLYDAFTSHTGQLPTDSTQNSSKDGSFESLDNLNVRPSTESMPPPKKDTFQVKSGIWADSLSRGLIDLNISTPKRVSLVDIGIVGTLSDGSDEKEKTAPPATYMGRAMGMGSGLARSKSGFASSSGTGRNDIFPTLGQQPQYGSFKK